MPADDKKLYTHQRYCELPDGRLRLRYKYPINQRHSCYFEETLDEFGWRWEIAKHLRCAQYFVEHGGGVIYDRRDGGDGWWYRDAIIDHPERVPHMRQYLAANWYRKETIDGVRIPSHSTP